MNQLLYQQAKQFLQQHPGAGKGLLAQHLGIKTPAARRLIVPAITGAVVLDFGQLASGRYAVSLIHDENSNGRLDTVLLIPREGYGFSRDARVRLGPPRFDSAAFEVDGQPAHLTVKMRYLF